MPTAGTKKVLRGATVGVVAVLAGVGGLAQDRRGVPAEAPALYVFFTPQDRITLDPAAVQNVRVIPHLLVDRGESLAANPEGDLPATLLDSIRSLESVVGLDNLDLPVINEHGLALARRYRITRTPAFVYAADDRHAHVAYGSQVDLKELVSCKR